MRECIERKMKISDLLKSNLVQIPEFQRKEMVWGKGQIKNLIYSVMKNFVIPGLTLVNIKGNNKPILLDGRQTLNAVTVFSKDEIKTIKYRSGKVFHELKKEQQKEFLDTTIPVRIYSGFTLDEAKENFILLQNGSKASLGEIIHASLSGFVNVIKHIIKETKIMKNKFIKTGRFEHYSLICSLAINTVMFNENNKNCIHGSGKTELLSFLEARADISIHDERVERMLYIINSINSNIDEKIIKSKMDYETLYLYVDRINKTLDKRTWEKISEILRKVRTDLVEYALYDEVTGKHSTNKCEKEERYKEFIRLVEK